MNSSLNICTLSSCHYTIVKL